MNASAHSTIRREKDIVCVCVFVCVCVCLCVYVWERERERGRETERDRETDKKRERGGLVHSDRDRNDPPNIDMEPSQGESQSTPHHQK